MSKPKKHHYLSKFYLAGFTLSGDNEGVLFCYDVKNKTVRPSKPINECYVKYFNKIESNEIDPNILEKELSKVEGSISLIFKYIHEKKELPKNEKFSELLYYIALIGVRNPVIRESFQEFKENVASKIFSLMLSDRKIWYSEMERINRETDNKFKDITYEEMKKFNKEKKWKLVELNYSTIDWEFKAVYRIYQLLHQRSWILLINDDDSNHFVTSDRPVKLIPNDFSHFKFGVGFGSRNTELYFPLSKSLLLRGSYKLPSTIMPVRADMVATLNTLQFFYTSRYIYSPTSDFKIYGKDKSIINVSAI
ncbi:MAG: DUF4238 domain-containing protein [Melioribacter sp.]|uniref:DUF4238 domain-containing protein n=1 Tax=Rosettibacter primus TaxID=3111523 RepID=UPI00247BEC3E|nr:DUF4238 domain-containing protein [Melioribacter sp.]